MRDGDWFLVTGDPTFGGGLASESGQLSHREVIAGLGEKWIIDISICFIDTISEKENNPPSISVV